MTLEEKEIVAKLPVERISRKAFESLPEYSCSDPTGVIPGKVWKRNLNAYGPMSHVRAALPRPPEWVLCEYVTTRPGFCGIEFRRPQIVEAETHATTER